ncbi:MAG: BrnA antitoxin family protein [Nitrospirota bacterium]
MRARRRSIKSDLKRLDAMSNGDIDYSDIPPLDHSFFTKAVVEWPKMKETVTIRIDEDVLRWFKAQGRGYQTRVNRLLRAFMEGKRRGDKAA